MTPCRHFDLTHPHVSPPDDGDRDCLSCGTVFATAQHPLDAECDETVNTDSPICTRCCVVSEHPCADCSQAAGEWASEQERWAS